MPNDSKSLRFDPNEDPRRDDNSLDRDDRLADPTGGAADDDVPSPRGDALSDAVLDPDWLGDEPIEPDWLADAADWLDDADEAA